MGVTGLWKLIEPCGKPVPVETLEGKILAVDISIWLHQVVKGFQDNKGAALNNAHLLGLFHRLCKLMYYRVKPVFVFDGSVPQLKRDTIARRQQQRSKLSNEADRIQNLLLQSLAKETVVLQALGPNAELLFTSPIKKKTAQNKDDSIDDMFKLPELPDKLPKLNEDESMDDSLNDSFTSTDGHTSASTDDSSYDESNPRNAYNSNLQSIDVRGKDFKQLPADVRHEILVDIKETRKQSSWGRLHELPAQSDDFSSFQMKRLLKRRDVQVSLEEVEKEMGNDHALTFSELTNIFTEEGILEAETLKRNTKQISSSEHTRFLLVRDLKKKLQKVEEEPENIQNVETKLTVEDELPSTSKSGTNSEEIKKMGNEYDADLELALALSLEEKDKVYDEKDYDYDSDEVLKLNKNQRIRLQDAAKGPARAYMIEYAGMNKDEVQGIVDETQINNEWDEALELQRLIGDDEISCKQNLMAIKLSETKNESQEIVLRVSDDSDDTDSDLEEVDEKHAEPALCITVDVNKAVADDLFADIFENKDKIEEEKEDDECVIPETPEFIEILHSEKTKTTFNAGKANFDRVFNVSQNKDAGNVVCAANETLQTQDKLETSTLQSVPEKQIDIHSKNKEILSILSELKQQVDNIKDIRLENIKLSSSVIEISDDELSQKVPVKDEIIEICDSDDNKRPTTPTIAEQSTKSRGVGESPKFKTPSKNHAITEFFNLDYVVKRTPEDKSQEKETEESPKIKSPFFVKKTPKSASKSGSSSPLPNQKISKASKSLFENDEKVDSLTSADEGVDILTPIVATEKDVITEAAALLKSNKTTDELNSLANNLAKERKNLESERNRQDRMSMSITQRMNSDCQELLKLFGVPYIIAPMEAEAQCAFLDIVQLTNGTITDDSDIWLFGGHTVYKNFFAQNKHVMEFRSEQIEKNFNCDRQKLIQLACLVGSDYTTGIHGIGAVTALEILASFSPRDEQNKPEDSIADIERILSTLQKFRDWWAAFKTAASPPGSSARLALQKKLKNIDLHEGFPNIAVVEAYLSPKVDENKEPLSWGYPDVESLREFAKKTFGWTTNKTDDILTPVMKKLNEKRTQQSIRNYFNVKNDLTLRQLKVSKRVQNAIDKMTGNAEETAEKPVKPKKARRSTKATTKKVTDQIAQNAIDEVSLTVEASSSVQVARGPCSKRIAAKRVNIPLKNDSIPQREKTLQQLEDNKKLAAELFKSTAKVVKKKRTA